MPSEYDVLNVFTHLIEAFFVFGLVESKEFCFAFALLHNEFLPEFLVVRTSVEFLDGADLDAVEILKAGDLVLLLNTAVLVIDKRVIDVVEVDLCVALLGLLGHSARTIHISLLYYLFVEVVCD